MCEYGLQLYSVRDITEKNLLDAIRKVASFGYKGMEFAGFFGNSAEDVKKCMDECGVSAWGTHTGTDQLTEDKLADTIAYHKAIGCKMCIVPGADFSTLEALKKLADIFAKAKPEMDKNGITLAYHNHDAEFLPNKDGIIAHDWLRDNTDISFEIDTFWSFFAGLDPLAKLEELGDRVVAIHLKDGIRENGNYDEGRPLGQGHAPVKAVRDYALARKLPIVVESESLTPDGPTEVKTCIDYLKSLEA